MQKKKIKILYVELWGASDPLTFSRPRRVTEEKMISLTIPHNSFVLLGGERHGETEVFFPRTQHIDPTRYGTQDSRPGATEWHYGQSRVGIEYRNRVFPVKAETLTV